MKTDAIFFLYSDVKKPRRFSIKYVEEFMFYAIKFKIQIKTFEYKCKVGYFAST